jgi:hypothetical protein
MSHSTYRQMQKKKKTDPPLLPSDQPIWTKHIRVKTETKTQHTFSMQRTLKYVVTNGTWTITFPPPTFSMN